MAVTQYVVTCVFGLVYYQYKFVFSNMCLNMCLPQVVPGETALAFFTAKNPSRKHITGVATYNVFPLKAGELS